MSKEFRGFGLHQLRCRQLIEWEGALRTYLPASLEPTENGAAQRTLLKNDSSSKLVVVGDRYFCCFIWSSVEQVCVFKTWCTLKLVINLWILLKLNLSVYVYVQQLHVLMAAMKVNMKRTKRCDNANLLTFAPSPRARTFHVSTVARFQISENHHIESSCFFLDRDPQILTHRPYTQVPWPGGQECWRSQECVSLPTLSARRTFAGKKWPYTHRFPQWWLARRLLQRNVTVNASL